MSQQAVSSMETITDSHPIEQDASNNVSQTEPQSVDFGEDDEDFEFTDFSSAPVTSNGQQPATIATVEEVTKSEPIPAAQALVHTAGDEFGGEDDFDDWNAFEGPTSAPAAEISTPAVSVPPAAAVAPQPNASQTDASFEADFDADFGDFETSTAAPIVNVAPVAVSQPAAQVSFNTSESGFGDFAAFDVGFGDAVDDFGDFSTIGQTVHEKIEDLSGFTDIDEIKDIMGTWLTKDSAQRYSQAKNTSATFLNMLFGVPAPAAAITSKSTRSWGDFQHSASPSMQWEEIDKVFHVQRDPTRSQIGTLSIEVPSSSSSSSNIQRQTVELLRANIPSDALSVDKLRCATFCYVTSQQVFPSVATAKRTVATEGQMTKAPSQGNLSPLVLTGKGDESPVAATSRGHSTLPNSSQPPSSAASASTADSVDSRNNVLVGANKQRDKDKDSDNAKEQIPSIPKIRNNPSKAKEINKNELSPVAFEYLSNLPDLSFLLTST